MEYRAKKFRTKEDFTKYVNAICEAYETTILANQVIIEVAHEMDGKVFNRRFENVIEDRLKEREIPAFINLSDRFNMGYKTLKICLLKRDVQINRDCIYFDDELYGNSIHNCENTFVEDKRIVADKAEAAILENIEHCKKYMQKWQDAAANYDEYTERLRNAVKRFGEELKGMNDLFLPSEIYKYDWEAAAK